MIMQAEEKRVLRRKRQTITSRMNVDETQLEFLIKKGVIDRHVAQQIRKESASQWKVSKLLDALTTNGNKSAYIALCDVIKLQTTTTTTASGKTASGLGEELMAELRLERGEIRVEDHIEREAAILVHKEFGSSRRLSELEKKDIQMLVARRTQVTKETWRDRLLACEKDLAKQETLNVDNEGKTKALIERLRSYIQYNKSRLRNDFGAKDHANGIRDVGTDESPRKVLDSGKASIDLLDKVITDMETLTTSCFLEHDIMTLERSKGFELLHMQDSHSKLDVAIERAIADLGHTISGLRDTSESKDKQIKILEEEITACNDKWQKEIDQKESTLQTMRAHLDKSHVKLRDLNEQCSTVRQELTNTKDELAKYRSKSTILERSRHLGYNMHDRGSSVNGGDGDRLPALPSRATSGDKSNIADPKKTNKSTLARIKTRTLRK